MLEKILNNSQSLLKTDVRYLLSGGFWLTSTKFIGMGTALISSVFFANLLTESEYGIYRYVLSVMILLVIPTLPGIDTALSRSIAQGKEASLFNALKAKIKWGLIGSLFSLGIAAYYFFQDNSLLGTAFIIVSIFIPLMEPSNIFIAYQTGKRQFKEQTLSQFTVRMVTTLALIITVFLTKNVIIILSVYLISYTALRLFFLWKITKHINLKKNRTDDDTVSFGKHLTMQGFPTVFTKTVDSLLVFQFAGAAAMAGYSLSLIPSKELKNILNSINILALPNFSKRTYQEMRSSLPNKVLKMYLVVVPIVLSYWILAPIFFEILYPKYTDYVLVSQILVLQLLSIPVSLFETALTALGAHKVLYIQIFSSAAIRLSLLFLLIPLYGALGAALALLISTLISVLVLTILFFSYNACHLPQENA